MLAYNEVVCKKCGMGAYCEVKSEGGQFSYKKAAIGTLLFGAVGAVAGINGKKTVTYKCNRCGHIIVKSE